MVGMPYHNGIHVGGVVQAGVTWEVGPVRSNLSRTFFACPGLAGMTQQNIERSFATPRFSSVRSLNLNPFPW
jgi:hypothetical protein